jgi:two-component system NarL family response regulator
VVDDHPVVRRGLVTLLKIEPGMEIVAEAGDGIEAVEQFRTHKPDVTLMDLRLPRMSGVEAIASIRQEFAAARIILLTTYDGDDDIYRGLQAGAKGYLLKDASCDEILDAIRAVHQGQKYLPVTVGAKLAERMDSPQLSERECEVLRQLAQGKSNQEIAKALGITEGTVKFHINKILPKLGVSDRTSAVIAAFRRGIASP